MTQIDDWWARQFVEGLKELTRIYDQFCLTTEIQDFDAAYMLHEELNEAYDMSLNLLEFVEIGRALLGKQTLPRI